MKCSALRLVVAHNRLTWPTGLALGQARGQVQLLSQTPACFFVFPTSLQMEEEVARQKAAAHPDTKRWFETAGVKRTYLITLPNAQRFIYVASLVDCWLSFLFVDLSQAEQHTTKQEAMSA